MSTDGGRFFFFFFSVPVCSDLSHHKHALNGGKWLCIWKGHAVMKMLSRLFSWSHEYNLRGRGSARDTVVFMKSVGYRVASAALCVGCERASGLPCVSLGVSARSAFISRGGEGFWGHVIQFICISSTYISCRLLIKITNENTVIATECLAWHPASVWEVLSCQDRVSKLLVLLWWMTARLITQQSLTNDCVFYLLISTFSLFCSLQNVWLGFIWIYRMWGAILCNSFILPFLMLSLSIALQV